MARSVRCPLRPADHLRVAPGLPKGGPVCRSLQAAGYPLEATRGRPGPRCRAKQEQTLRQNTSDVVGGLPGGSPGPRHGRSAVAGDRDPAGAGAGAGRRRAACRGRRHPDLPAASSVVGLHESFTGPPAQGTWVEESVSGPPADPRRGVRPRCRPVGPPSRRTPRPPSGWSRAASGCFCRASPVPVRGERSSAPDRIETSRVPPRPSVSTSDQTVAQDGLNRSRTA